VKQQLLSFAAADLETDVTSLTLKGDEVISVKDAAVKVKIHDVAGLKKRGVIVGVGYRGPNPEGKVVNPFAAQFCEVEVNALTGEVRIIRFLGCHDSGRVMNRLTYDNQVFGGITMGIGLAMTEARVLDREQTGKMVNRNLHDYRLPTSLDVPVEMTSLPIEKPDDTANTIGAKGLGEPVTIPTAAAVANAIYNAVGIRMTGTPMTPLQLRLALEKGAKEGPK
jgi:xanthine dehydrogenase YagR molybdenum-binding subunit